MTKTEQNLWKEKNQREIKMEFREYMHLERYGKEKVLNIENGECFIFPKLDGTNSSVWLDNGKIQAGSRKRHLSQEEDNFGFFKWVLKQENLINYLKENPTHRLFGEWLVPHELRTYRKDAWERFYVFDVAVEVDNKLNYLHFHFYKPLLVKHNIEFVPPIVVLKNFHYQQLVDQLKNNDFLVEEGIGEGIVVKNYDFRNREGRTVWAKLISSEFEEQKREKGIPRSKLLEEVIAKQYVTTAFCKKEFAKMKHDAGVDWTSQMSPKLLDHIFSEMVREECWNFVKENKNPTINFSTLKYFVIAKIQEKLPIIPRIYFKIIHHQPLAEQSNKNDFRLEEEIAERYVTTVFCEKEFAKMKNDAAVGWTSQMIPKLLDHIFSEILKEECGNFVSENGNPTINFSKLKYHVIAKIREKLPNVFRGVRRNAS